MYIDDIFFLDKLSRIEEDVFINSKRRVENLSHWNSSPQYNEVIMKTLSPQSLINMFEYVYTYNIDIKLREKVIDKIIGRNVSGEMCLLLPNSTLAIVNVVNMLKHFGYTHLVIIQPSYFSVEVICNSYGISVENISYEKYKSENYSFDGIKINETTAVWFTSPLYSTSVTLNSKIIEHINTLTQNNHLVIIDESVNLNGFETIRKLNINKYLIGIYSPHKSLFLNGIKFSAIICDKSYDDFLEQWVDVVTGSLPGSCINGINHFLDNNFDMCNNTAQKWFYYNKKTIIKILEKYPHIQIDTNTSTGAYTSINIPDISLNNMDIIKKIIYNTNTSFIPGFLEGNAPGSFRINLALNNNQIGCGLNSIIEFIYHKKF